MKFIIIIGILVSMAAAFLAGAMWNDSLDSKFRINLIEAYTRCLEGNGK